MKERRNLGEMFKHHSDTFPVSQSQTKSRSPPFVTTGQCDVSLWGGVHHRGHDRFLTEHRANTSHAALHCG